MFSISLTFAIVGMVSSDLSADEIKKILGSRNENFAVNMIQGLDSHIEKRILDFQELTKIDPIQTALASSNKEFEKIENVEEYLQLKEQEIEFDITTPFFGSTAEEILAKDLQEEIEFYRDEYNYDVIEELFVTNAYGANVALGTGTSDFSQSDEEWWQKAKENGKNIGQIQYSEIYESYSIDFAYRIDDAEGNFIGVMRVLITLDDLLDEFREEDNLLATSGRTVLLLDQNGNPIYSKEKIEYIQSPVPYFSELEKEHGFFEIFDPEDDFRLISYAQSIGYKTFEGFGWIAIVEQNRSSIVGEFVDLRNSIVILSITGMIASVIGGLIISGLVSSPLKNLTKTAELISKGNFDVKIQRSSIGEIQNISNSLEQMAKNLKKLFETEKQLAEATAKIKKERLTAIGELAASIAHDMKNPLATIKTSAEILEKNAKEGELKEVVDRMYRATDRISHQINDVLNYVRITPLELRKIKITELLKRAQSSLTIPKNITVSFPESNVEIQCDADKMEIVFINLILNAIQAIGSIPGEIQISIKPNESQVEIQVQDTGPGIPEEILSKIFKPLVTSKQKGTGLGLSSCKNIVEQHNGKISAFNNPTRFIISLPLEPDKD